MISAELAYADALTGINVAAIDAACADLPATTVWTV